MLGPEEKLNEGQQDGGGAQQVVLQNGQNVELQNINATNMREEGNHTFI